LIRRAGNVAAYCRTSFDTDGTMIERSRAARSRATLIDVAQHRFILYFTTAGVGAMLKRSHRGT
jgi:hypothetical protein